MFNYRVLSAIEKVAETIYVPPNTTFEAVEDNIAIIAIAVDDSTFEGITLETNIKPRDKLSTGFVSMVTL